MNKYEDGDFLLSPAAFLRILQQISVRNLAKVVLTAAGPPKSVTTNLASSKQQKSAFETRWRRSKVPEPMVL